MRNAQIFIIFFMRLTYLSKFIFGHGKKAWFLNHINDVYVKKANQLNYRSRASFKLIQILKKYPVLIESYLDNKISSKVQQNDQSKGQKEPKLVSKVLDLGSAPGSWSQVLKQLLPESQIVAADLLDMKPIKGVDFYKCDARSKELQKILAQKYGKFQVIVSDMAPNFDGDAANTHLQILQLNCLCVQLCLELGTTSCSLVMKSVQGQTEKNFFNLLNQIYINIHRQKPSSSRSQSMQFFYVCQKLRPLTLQQNLNLANYMKNFGLNTLLQLEKHRNKKQSTKYFQNILNK